MGLGAQSAVRGSLTVCREETTAKRGSGALPGRPCASWTHLGELGALDEARNLDGPLSRSLRSAGASVRQQGPRGVEGMNRSFSREGATCVGIKTNLATVPCVHSSETAVFLALINTRKVGGVLTSGPRAGGWVLSGGRGGRGGGDEWSSS